MQRCSKMIICSASILISHVWKALVSFGKRSQTLNIPPFCSTMSIMFCAMTALFENGLHVWATSTVPFSDFLWNHLLKINCTLIEIANGWRPKFHTDNQYLAWIMSWTIKWYTYLTKYQRMTSPLLCLFCTLLDSDWMNHIGLAFILSRSQMELLPEQKMKKMSSVFRCNVHFVVLVWFWEELR